MAVASVGLKAGNFARLACKALGNGSLQSAAFSVRREAHASTTNYSSSDADEVNLDNLDCDSINAALNSKPVEQHEISANTVSPVLPVLPNAIVTESETETFWAPDPETGVFAPADESEINVNGGGSLAMPPPHPTGNGLSVLDQTVWVREIEVEEVEKPPPTDLMEEH